MRPTRLSRRQFLKLALGAGALAAGGWAWPTGAPEPAGTPPEYFVPLEDYHELPPECYEPNLIRPVDIILHWDGNTKGRDLWVTAITYETLKLLGQSAHFAVDAKRTWQLLPMYRRVVQESHGAKGYNWGAINIELAGVDFDAPGNAPPAAQTERAVRLTALLMDFYGLAFEHVVGHYERDDRGLKTDPGVQFMAGLREQLAAYRAARSPVKSILLSNA